MDREPEELQFLGFVGIYKEAYKSVSTCRRLFSQITLALILPLSFIFLAHIQISDLIFTKIVNNEAALDYTQSGSPTQDKILNRLSSEWTAFLLFKAAYLLFVLVFSLLSTSAVVYTIACLYTAKDVTFRTVISIVPKVWMRLMVTFLWNFFILLGYNTLAILSMVLSVLLIGPNAASLTVVIILLILYIIGLVYISIVWHLASVISVLEDSYGIAAMMKAKSLIKGKVWVTSAIFLTLNLGFIAINIGFAKFVVHGPLLGLVARAAYAIIFFVLLSVLILLGLVIQTIVYFMCKSYHHESIDKSCLADHLEVYMGDYVPLKGRGVQLEEFYA
ncbi:uncharacterized protein LOC143858166 [Tasmannia lanceolata]|uniref:uncharacterized protein LOC143858166 n=1 Tax=Tasmannia lanceolata TaxID=3420 RepID=UPI00406295CE